jgi:hypothetical protein
MLQQVYWQYEFKPVIPLFIAGIETIIKQVADPEAKRYGQLVPPFGVKVQFTSNTT